MIFGWVWGQVQGKGWWQQWQWGTYGQGMLEGSVLRLGNPGRRSRDCYEQRKAWTRVGLGASVWLQGIRFYKVQGLHVRPQSLVVLSCCLKSAALASNLLDPQLRHLGEARAQPGALSSACIGEQRTRQLGR